MRVEPHLWGVVLSGGEGTRLKALARRICGDERPKQYVPV
jgi:mannose-1-phosphate guanylyltransferase